MANKVSKPRGTMLSLSQATDIASDWHSGQGSAFYSLASTRKYVDSKYDSYIKEVDKCLEIAADKKQKDRLNKLKKWFTYKRWEAQNK